MEKEEEKKRCESLVGRIHNLPLSKLTSSCKSTLLRLAISEVTFLSRPSLPSSSSSTSPFSCNVGYIEAVVHILEQPYITGVSRVCKLIPFLSESNCIEENETKCQAVHVDIVCSFNKKPTWFIVSDRNPKYISWDVSGRNKGLKRRLEQIVHAAQYSQALKPDFVVLFFANGLDDVILEEVSKNFGFREIKLEFSHFEFAFVNALEGEWVHVVGKSYQKACTLMMDVDQSQRARHSVDNAAELSSTRLDIDSTVKHKDLSSQSSFDSLIQEMREWSLDAVNMEYVGLKDEDLVNFDTTSLIAIVSGISNGGAENVLATSEVELRERFKNNKEFVIAQAQSELKNPIHAEFSIVLSAKRGIICESVHSEFMELVSMCGGVDEQIRAGQFVKRLKIVPDSPSLRMTCLPTTRKLAMKNKITFGTGDFWGAPTLTANMGFVRAVLQTGMSLLTYEHRPRALIGN